VQQIGKYQVLKILGQGGMGTVYEALDPHIRRRVAVKTMTPGLADDPVLRQRFLREAQAAGGLRHRNIVTVYDLGEDQGQPYIAMEMVEGADLEQVIRAREPVSLEWKLAVLRQVCEALAHAHRHGIVHRDVKPANIRVTPEGEVKIMDFGIAHLQSSTMTRGGQVLGTVHYMAPEQVDGRRVDHRADIFSVGAIAFELLSYRRPFDGDSITNVLLKITQESPDPALLPATEFSPRLEQIVMKALAREVDHRYASLDEMADALADLAGDQPRAPEREAPAARAYRLAQEAREALTQGDLERAQLAAREALSLVPESEAAKALVRQVEAEGLQRRVEHELAEIRSEAERAHAEGRFQQAITLCRKVLELNPDDAEAARLAAEVQAAMHEREAEQLSGMALAYAADGDMELALKIADRLARLAPGNAKAQDLRRYLEEEAGRRTAEALVATAQEHLALGNLDEARAAAEEALEALPSHALAREIRDRCASVLATRRQAETVVVRPAPPVVAAPPPPPPAPGPAPAPQMPVAAVAPVAAAPPPPVPASPPAAASPAAATPSRPPVPEVPSPATVAVPARPPAAAVATATPPPVVPHPPAAPPRAVTAPSGLAPSAPAPSAPAPSAPAPSAPAPSAPALSAPAPSGPAPSAAASPPASGVRAPGPAVPSAPAPGAPAREELVLTPLPEGPPASEDAARALDSARRHLRERAPEKALPLLEEAARLDPAHAGIRRLLGLTRAEATRANAEALTSKALDHFMKNEYKKARATVEKALELEPANKKAKELRSLLAALLP
jgi:serine/threonine-protein kinase